MEEEEIRKKNEERVHSGRLKFDDEEKQKKCVKGWTRTHLA